MTSYWAVNSTADDGRLAICPVCVCVRVKVCVLHWFGLRFFWECPSKGSSGMKKNSSATSTQFSSAETLRQCICLLWDLGEAVKVTFFFTAICHHWAIRWQPQKMLLKHKCSNVSWPKQKAKYQFWSSYLCTMCPLQSLRECMACRLCVCVCVCMQRAFSEEHTPPSGPE